MSPSGWSSLAFVLLTVYKITSLRLTAPDSATVPINFVLALFGSRYRFTRSFAIIFEANLTSAAAEMLLSSISLLAVTARSVPTATIAIKAPMVEATSISTSVNPPRLKGIRLQSL
jgi:hypothetical protein